MQELNFPPYIIKTRTETNRTEVFDIVRNTWILLTPEEWVRQHVLHFLVYENNIPKSLIAVEMPIKMNNMQRRCDIVVFTNSGKPKMIIECKAPQIKLTQSAADQAGRYNLTLKTPFLVITNGIQHFSFLIDFENQKTKSLDLIPNYDYLLRH